MSQFELRPGITNPKLWYPERPPRSEWRRIRKIVLDRDNWTCAGCDHRAEKWMHVHHLENSENNDPDNLITLCVACHAILHVGRSLMHKAIEVWKSEIPQIDIVCQTRKGVRNGQTLEDVKEKLPISRGAFDPGSTKYANELVAKAKKENEPRVYLDKPLCAVFVKMERWQLESEL